MRATTTRTPLALLIAAALLAAPGGCPQAPSDWPPPLEWPPVIEWPPNARDVTYTIPIEGITVKIINQTDQLLDPQIYVAPAADGLDELFVAENKRTDFGFGGMGVVLPFTSVSLSVACGRDLLIATKGGVFGEDLSRPIGSGERLVLQEGLSVPCGALIELYFAPAGVELDSSYAVTP